MKFATAKARRRTAGGANLLQAMLHHFCRIHAAKHSFRNWIAVDPAGYSSQLNGLIGIPLRRPKLWHAAPMLQQTRSKTQDTKTGAHFHGRPI
jgi:hypothetical protein